MENRGNVILCPGFSEWDRLFTGGITALVSWVAVFCSSKLKICQEKLNFRVSCKPAISPGMSTGGIEGCKFCLTKESD